MEMGVQLVAMLVPIPPDLTVLIIATLNAWTGVGVCVCALKNLSII